jgi:hypothetical protein
MKLNANWTAPEIATQNGRIIIWIKTYTREKLLQSLKLDSLSVENYFENVLHKKYYFVSWHYETISVFGTFFYQFMKRKINFQDVV